MEAKATIIGSLFEKTEDYAKTSIDLIKLQALDKSANAVSSAVSVFVILISTLCVITMVNIGAALWIGKLIGSYYSGFFIVAIFYAVVSLVLYIFKDSIIKTPISNLFITHIRKEKHI